MSRPTVKLERVRITKVGVWYIGLALVVGVAATNTGNNALYLVASVMLAVLAVSGFASKRNLSGLEVTFGVQTEVYSGQVFSVPVTVTNTDRFFARRYIVVGGFPEMESLLIPYLGRGESTNERLGILIKKRGLHKYKFLRLVSVFPLGLFEKGMRLPADLEVLVFPEIYPASDLLQLGSAREGDEPSRKVGWSHELKTLRAFRPGDDPRGIHWKRTARTGDLVFMEREAEEGLQLAILLDNAVAPLTSQLDIDRFERLVSEAASAAVHYLAQGYEVSLTTRGEAIPFGGGLIHRRRLLTALALLEPSRRLERPLWSGRRGSSELRLTLASERRAS